MDLKTDDQIRRSTIRDIATRFSSSSKPGAYIPHNATWPLIDINWSDYKQFSLDPLKALCHFFTYAVKLHKSCYHLMWRTIKKEGQGCLSGYKVFLLRQERKKIIRIRNSSISPANGEICASQQNIKKMCWYRLMPLCTTIYTGVSADLNVGRSSTERPMFSLGLWNVSNLTWQKKVNTMSQSE